MKTNRFKGLILTCPHCKKRYPISDKEVNECPLCLRVYMKHYTVNFDRSLSMVIRWIDNQHVYKTETYSAITWAP